MKPKTINMKQKLIKAVFTFVLFCYTWDNFLQGANIYLTHFTNVLRRML